MKTLPNCQSCGACCIAEYDADFHAELNDAEADVGAWSPEGKLSRYVTEKREYGNEGCAVKTKWRAVTTGPLQGLQICACSLLQGDPMVSVTCRCYDVRPRVCRDFRPGSKTCREAIAWLERQAEESNNG
jgi:Fe-S-cluster containining protein